MKKIFLFASILASALTFAQKGTIMINGTGYSVDTLENYYVGPGVQYTQFNFTMGSIKHQCYLYTVDMTNPYNKIEEGVGGEQMGKTELMTSTHQRIDSAGHRPIGSVNCNFWVVSSQCIGHWDGLINQPFSGTAKDGVLIGNPSEDWNRGHGTTLPTYDPLHEVGFAMITSDKRAVIDDYRFNAYVEFNGEQATIRDCNRTRKQPDANEICLFNHYLGTSATRATDGIEVVFELDDPWGMNKEINCTVVSINNVGGTLIQKGQAVFQGRGTGKAFLEKMSVGSKFKMNLGIETRDIATKPDIMQMVTGNCLVLYKGKQTHRNTDEDYNNKNYPRTMLATNDDGSIFWMLVSATPGNYTAEMCGMLQNVGATYAIGMDGGGSAQLNLFGKIQNKTTENSPRAVANSLFVVSTAPDDNNIGMLRFMDAKKTTLASYADYTPQVLSYNQYGAFLSKDCKTFTLSCEPSSLGTISEDGMTFTAGPNAGTGKLIATYGNARVEKDIEIQEGRVSFAFDSVLVGNRDYSIDVFSSTPDKKLRVNPAQLTWRVADENICAINENGILHAISNGRTLISGTLGSFSDDLIVNVELANNPHISSEYVMDTTFQFSSTRNANLELKNLGIRIYGCPDSILITVQSTTAIKEMGFEMQANNGSAQYFIRETPAAANEETIHIILPSDFADKDDAGIYPLHINRIKAFFESVKSKTDYTFQIKSIVACYQNFMPEGIESIMADPMMDGQKIMMDGILYIVKGGHLYNLNGQVIK